MSSESPDEQIVVTEDGKTLPAIDVLTGRAFLTGKSGSGKSHSCSVIAEELLERSFNLMIIDAEGEYFGLKERYQLLHVGADEFADVNVSPADAERIAQITLTHNVPVIIDVSGFDDGDEAEELIERVVAELFQIEKRERKPYLLVVEEMQEFLPQKGGGDDLAELLERVAKRGRKRGLGICGISQRPSSVDKDFITQCDWMGWHKLTWQNDLDVVKRILGPERAEVIQEFDPGEAFLMTDWDDRVDRIRFRQKRTHDAGATPGLERYERPDLQAVGDEILRDLGDGSGVTRSEAELETVPEGSARAEVSTNDRQRLSDELLVEFESEESERRRSIDEIEDETELRGALERSRERNQRLRERVRELESALDLTESTDSQLDSSAPASSTAFSGREIGTASRPSTPKRPVNRSGVGGNLLEFGELVMYLFQWLSYPLRLLVYQLRNA